MANNANAWRVPLFPAAIGSGTFTGRLPLTRKLIISSKLDFADFCAVGSDAGPEDRRFRDDAHGLFDGGGGASKGAERNPSFLPQ